MEDKPVEVRHKGFIIRPDEMEVDKYYTFEYEGENYAVVKGESGKIYFYEAEGE